MGREPALHDLLRPKVCLRCFGFRVKNPEGQNNSSFSHLQTVFPDLAMLYAFSFQLLSPIFTSIL